MKTAVAGKTVESIHALKMMAITRGMLRLVRDLDDAATAIDPKLRA